VDPIPYLNGNAAVPSLPVSGRSDKASWRAWQTWLQDKGFSPGRIDGIPGPITYRAIQHWAGVPRTGHINDVTLRAVQAKLGVKQDAIWGRDTWSTLQRKLNDGSLV
jgi:peptidoglycan hydrolase-like protein with peptidoglycan-binding domain